MRISNGSRSLTEDAALHYRPGVLR